MHRSFCLVLVASLASVVCGGASTPAAESPAPIAVAADPSPDAQAGPAGRVAFTVDGQEKTFTHAPAGNNFYNRLGSGMLVRPAADATEQFMITFLGMNLRDGAFPAELPRPRDPGNPMSAMANVGFSYKAPDGQEWAGPGRVHVESFGADGLIEGRFANVSLPHTGKSRPNVVVTDGTFRVQLTNR